MYGKLPAAPRAHRLPMVICSAQFRNLCNLEIALHILGIRKLRANLEIAQYILQPWIIHRRRSTRSSDYLLAVLVHVGESSQREQSVLERNTYNFIPCPR